MKSYNVSLKFTAQYLQARFSDEAKEELLESAKKSIVKNPSEEDLNWIKLLHFDEKGIYVPSDQIESMLINSGKDFKMKAKRTSLKEYVKAVLFVKDEKNYIGKKEPDELLTSYPKRKDGNRVKLVHPSFKIGTKVDFVLECLDDDFSDKTVKELFENGGKRYGLGARRPKFGRFELIDIKRNQ